MRIFPDAVSWSKMNYLPNHVIEKDKIKSTLYKANSEELFRSGRRDHCRVRSRKPYWVVHEQEPVKNPQWVNSASPSSVTQKCQLTDVTPTNLACASADKPIQWTTTETITTSKQPPLLSQSPPIVKVNRTEGVDIINSVIQTKNRYIFADCLINELDSGPQNTESHNDITNANKSKSSC